MVLGECDCCAKPNRLLHLCVAYGMDTAACSVCRGDQLSDDVDELEAEIEFCLGYGADTMDLESALVEARNDARADR